MKNIVLTGLPGSGKTTLGYHLAKERNMKFIDLDEGIEKSEGVPIKEIFEKHGESYFRGLETQAAAKASELENTVISTGGGIVLKDENMRLLSEKGVIVFINRDPAAISKDIKTGNRPMMGGNVGRIWQLNEQRHALYKKYCDYELLNDDIQNTLSHLVKIADTAKRKLKLAVIGDPIEHSLSPDIHLPVLTRLCNKAEYERVKIEKNNLSDWIKKVRDEGIDGFNVTMPHKIDIIPFLDEIDEDAILYHAVNTVVNRNGRLYGYSTDGSGFLTMVTQQGYRFAGANIVLFGAGGAASTIALKIASQRPKRLTILALNTNDAQLICGKVRQIDSGIDVNGDEMTDETMRKYCKTANILINATPLGMKDVAEFKNFDFLKQMPPDALVCDIVYHPMKTKLLIEAENSGHPVLGGIGMLIYQAILSDEFYLSIKFNLHAMREKIIKILERKDYIS